MANTDNLKPFKKGQSGNPNGRPKGSRNLLCEQFFKDMMAAWKEHGITALAKMAEDNPNDFVKVAAGLMPKNVELDQNIHVTLADVLRERAERSAVGTDRQVRDESDGLRDGDIAGHA